MKVDLFSKDPFDPSLEARLTDFSPEPHRVEVPLVAPDDSQYKVILLDAEDTFDVVIQHPNGEREAVWSLVKEGDLPEIPIRNYKGEIPEGTWYCGGCDYHTSLLTSAASHAEKNDCWVYLFPLAITSDTVALMEMHPSDSAEGVYLNEALSPVKWHDYFVRRDNEIAGRKLQGHLHTD